MKKRFPIGDILDSLKIKELNEMQKSAMAAISENQDVLLLSRTGSGKTLAFLLPLLQKLDTTSSLTQAIIIVPSRELALQIEGVFKSLKTGLKVTCCYGGHLRETEENNLKQPPFLLVGTPGRLSDHLRRGNIAIDDINIVILDEFDKSFELGFQEEMEFIIKSLPGIKQRIFTSATEAIELPAFVGHRSPIRIDFLHEVDEEGSGLETLFVKSIEKDKLQTLLKLICWIGDRSAVIFCNHRESVERTHLFLKEQDIVSVFYHGALEQMERETSLAKFKNGTAQVLVTTDLAARGLDILNIRYIIHYHLPVSQDVFTHRNGRTARMDASGTAIIILSPDEVLPNYIDPTIDEITLPVELDIPEKPKWTTLFIAAGKKDKINKVDIVGFLMNRGHLKKEDIGLIDVRDFTAFVAVKKSKANVLLPDITDQKLKNKKVKIKIAK